MESRASSPQFLYYAPPLCDSCQSCEHDSCQSSEHDTNACLHVIPIFFILEQLEHKMKNYRIHGEHDMCIHGPIFRVG